MRKNFLVIGEVCLDIFRYGICKRLSPEAPVPVFNPTSEIVNSGMAYNTYHNLVSIIEQNGNVQTMNVDKIFSNHDSPIPEKIRYVDEKTNHLFLRVDVNDDKFLPYEETPEYKLLIKNSNYILISDYDKGFLKEDDISYISTINPKAKVYLDTKKIISENIMHHVDFVKINQSELEQNSKSEGWSKVFGRYKDKFIITMGESGAKWSDTHFAVEKKHKTIDVSGAGDTFMAAFVYAHAISSDVPKSITFANKLASYVVTKRGVSIV